MSPCSSDVLPGDVEMKAGRIFLESRIQAKLLFCGLAIAAAPKIPSSKGMLNLGARSRNQGLSREIVEDKSAISMILKIVSIGPGCILSPRRIEGKPQSRLQRRWLEHP